MHARRREAAGRLSRGPCGPLGMPPFRISSGLIESLLLRTNAEPATRRLGCERRRRVGLRSYGGRGMAP